MTGPPGLEQHRCGQGTRLELIGSKGMLQRSLGVSVLGGVTGTTATTMRQVRYGCYPPAGLVVNMSQVSGEYILGHLRTQRTGTRSLWWSDTAYVPSLSWSDHVLPRCERWWSYATMVNYGTQSMVEQTAQSDYGLRIAIVLIKGTYLLQGTQSCNHSYQWYLILRIEDCQDCVWWGQTLPRHVVLMPTGRCI